MIISPPQKQVFCHIPKNGGTSLRRYFLDRWESAREHQGRKPVAALDGATRDLTHLTVGEAETWFGESLIEGGYRITAVIRAPGPRVASALAQYIRSFGPKGREGADGDTVAAVLAETPLPTLCAKAADDHRCIYFRRQSDFLDGVPGTAQDLVLLEDLATRFPDLPHENRGGALPGWLKPLAGPAVRRAAGALGGGLKARLKSALVRPDTDMAEAITTALAQERAFIEDFYAPDQALYDGLKTALRPPPPPSDGPATTP